jgi:hypothetical protein
MPDMPSIPTPIKGDANSVHDVLMEMKQAIEIMMGTRGNSPTTRTFVQEGTPTAFVVGDHWIQPSTGRMSYWSGSAWQFVRAVP